MSCLCQDRFKQTTADIVEEKPRVGGFFATKFAYVLIRPMPLGQRFGWARRVSSGKTSCVGPPLKSSRRNRSRSGAGSRASGRPVSRPGGLFFPRPVAGPTET